MTSFDDSDPSDAIEELSISEISYIPSAPALFTSPPVLYDRHITQTSRVQDETAASILRRHLDPLPSLDRAGHIRFLTNAMGKLPSFMVALDASRPWLHYWCLNGLAILGHDVSHYRDRLVSSLTPLQGENGGLGGSHGHTPHMACSYAGTLALAVVGGKALSLLHRPSLLGWLLSNQQPDGGFSVAAGGEVDVRAIYCALTIFALLRLPTDGLDIDKITEYLVKCQTYEGGFGQSPYGNEAHGGYTFCALAALYILYSPREIARLIDVPSLVRWLSARQSAPEGGFSGRTNKLVDACYATWIGGCWSLVEACLNSSPSVSIEGDLWSREGLVRYILAAAQSEGGGMRDKPGKGRDAYHTNYALAGLSAAQWRWRYDEREGEETAKGLPLRRAFRWVCEGIAEGEEGKVWSEGDKVKPVHPVLNLPLDVVEQTLEWVDEEIESGE